MTLMLLVILRRRDRILLWRVPMFGVGALWSVGFHLLDMASIMIPLTLLCWPIF